jgi:hypothetical protein
MRQWLAQALVPILGALSVLLGVLALGRGTRAALHDRPEYTLSFSDIQCDPPHGMARGDFLREVRDCSPPFDPMHLLDEDLAARLARAFAAHPWVESVGKIEMQGSKAGVRVQLVYRQAVLAVALSGGKIPRDGSALVETWSAMGRNALVPARAVDRHGVLLPVSAAHSQLPVLTAEAAAPAGPPGSQWGDRSVAMAAATVGFLKADLDRLHLSDCDLEIVQGEVVFRKPGVRVMWGHAPGHEVAEEAPAPLKLRRLLDYQARHGGLDSLEHDVRLLAHQGHFPLSLNGQP